MNTQGGGKSDWAARHRAQVDRCTCVRAFLCDGAGIATSTTAHRHSAPNAGARGQRRRHPSRSPRFRARASPPALLRGGCLGVPDLRGCKRRPRVRRVGDARPLGQRHHLDAVGSLYPQELVQACATRRLAARPGSARGPRTPPRTPRPSPSLTWSTSAVPRPRQSLPPSPCRPVPSCPVPSCAVPSRAVPCRPVAVPALRRAPPPSPMGAPRLGTSFSTSL